MFVAQSGEQVDSSRGVELHRNTKTPPADVECPQHARCEILR